MKILSLVAVAGVLALSGGANALPLSPAASLRLDAPVQTANVLEVHHKPGHVGGRGRHLGWYKGNRGKKKGWRRWR